MCKKYIVTWDMMQIYAKILSLKLYKYKNKFKWNKIIAISRGGLVPCSIISRELEIRYVDTICVSSYNHDCFKETEIIKHSIIKDKNILIVDDLADTGRTIKIIKKIYPYSYFVTIFAKPLGRKLVDNYVINIPQKTWIEQPWDMEFSYTPPIVIKNNS
ncbi:xanthine phosphoribosyltransferase [Buchnera aphidicola]|uniref:xanthine phosphoribosyltransferase n=1 Tax=Buchnera aphidicola TaxID=9 RepID=UPI0030EF46C3